MMTTITLHPLTIPRPVADAAHYLTYWELYAPLYEADDDDAPTRPMTLAERYAWEWGRLVDLHQRKAEAAWRGRRGRAMAVVGHYTALEGAGRATPDQRRRLKVLNKTVERRVRAIRAQVAAEWAARSQANTCRALVIYAGDAA